MANEKHASLLFFDGGYNYQLIAWMANEKHASLSDESGNGEIKTFITTTF